MKSIRAYLAAGKFSCRALILGSLLLVAATANADLIFADSFDYHKGLLDGMGPPPGSPPGQGGWAEFNGSPFVASAGLNYPGILSSGNSAKVFSDLGDNGDKAVAALGPVTAEDGSIWVGFLARRARGSFFPIGYAVVSLGNDVTGPSVGIGKLFNRGLYGLDNNTGNNSDIARTTVTPNGDTVWLVTKLDFATAQEYLWVNPSPETEPDIAQADASLPMTPAFLAAGFHEIVLKIGYVYAIYQFDELRVGTTFADVVGPVNGP
jgi:hypothetical protein